MRSVLYKIAPLLVSVALTGCSDTVDLAAKIGDIEVTKAQVSNYLLFKRIPDSDSALKEKALDNYLQRKSIAHQIEIGGTLDQGAITAELEDFKHEMLISRYFEKFLQDNVTEASLRNYFAQNSTQFDKRKVKVSHILLRTNARMSGTEKAAVKTRMHEVYSKLQTGEPFSEVASNYSDDKASAKNGGTLGWVDEGAIAPTFSTFAFSAEVGTVSEPVETAYGYHLIKVLEAPKSIKPSFESVKGLIRHRLRTQVKAKEVERLLANTDIKKV